MLIYFCLYTVIFIILSSTDAEVFDPVEFPSVGAKNTIWNIYNKHKGRMNKKNAFKRTRKEFIAMNVNCSGWMKDNIKTKENFVTRCIDNGYPPKPQQKELSAAKRRKIN